MEGLGTYPREKRGMNVNSEEKKLMSKTTRSVVFLVFKSEVTNRLNRPVFVTDPFSRVACFGKDLPSSETRQLTL